MGFGMVTSDGATLGPGWQEGATGSTMEVTTAVSLVALN